MVNHQAGKNELQRSLVKYDKFQLPLKSVASMLELVFLHQWVWHPGPVSMLSPILIIDRVSILIGMEHNELNETSSFL